jgi:hypothetical protein
MRKTEQEFSEQVRDGDMSVRSGDAMARIAGLVDSETEQESGGRDI